MTLRFSIELAADAMVVDRNDLTRLHIADVFRTNHIERACLAGNYISITNLSESERMESILVTARIDSAACHHKKRKSAVKHIEGILQCMDTRQIPVHALLLDEVSEHLRI